VHARGEKGPRVLASTYEGRDPGVPRINPREKNSLACSPPGCVTVSNTMVSNTQSGHDPAELGELERSILSIIWRLGKVTAEQVREDLDRGLKDSTVRTVLRR